MNDYAIRKQLIENLRKPRLPLVLSRHRQVCRTLHATILHSTPYAACFLIVFSVVCGIH